MLARHLLACSLALVACGGATTTTTEPAPAPLAPARPPAPPPPPPVTITVLGTSDLHGRVEALPLLAGYVANARKARAADGGGVILVDGGDMFQGTLESNLGEGAVVVRAYNAIGYTAVAIGNHEFDYGPVGEASVARKAGEDPQGALKERAKEAKFPFLAADLYDVATRKPVTWDNVHPSTLLEVAGKKVGIIGVSTEDTPRTTIIANFAGLEIAPLARTIIDEAANLRARGATVIVVTAHAGGNCKKLDDPKDLSSCDNDAEIFKVARDLPAGTVDAMVGGHTHAAVAQEINGIPITQSYANGQAFGRIDLEVNAQGRVVGHTQRPPQYLCRDPKQRGSACEPSDYEGAPVVADAEVAKAVAPAIELARARRQEKLGIIVSEAVKRAYDRESALGDLATDFMRTSRPGVDVAITNGGGLRADLPAGELTYGEVFEAFPFDNRFAFIKMRAADLAQIVSNNLQKDFGILSFSGMRVLARCEAGALKVTLSRPDGKPIKPEQKLVVATSDFLATGGDSFFGGAKIDESAITMDDGPPFREAIVAGLRKRGGTLSGSDPKIFDPKKPRLDYEGKRPVTCR